MPQFRQMRLTDLSSPLPLRHRESPPGRTTASSSSRRPRQAPNTPQATRDESSSAGKKTERVEVVLLDEDSDGADDEDPNGSDQEEGRGRHAQKVPAAGKAAKEVEGRKASVGRRPAGRMWLARVEIRSPKKKGAARAAPATGGPPTPISQSTSRKRRSSSVTSGGGTSDVLNMARRVLARPTARGGRPAAGTPRQRTLLPSDTASSQSEPSPKAVVDLTGQSEDSVSDFNPDDDKEESSEHTDEESVVASSDAEEEVVSSTDGSVGPPKRKQLTLGTSVKKAAPVALARQPAGLPRTTGRNNDTWQYKPGINHSLPPLHRIEDIFDDLTEKAMSCGFNKAVDYLQGRKIKLATMCSGTESPMLALGLTGESLAKVFKRKLEVEHVFSAEIVPYKQAYIERNFSPPYIFRDIRELVVGDEATTAYGAEVPVPGDVDMLVAGFSCVDFSNLNSHKRTIEQVGESSDTFRAIWHYAKVKRPTMIVLENVCSAPWAKIEKAWGEANYAAGFVKLDTKHYYIPHTRQRGYMLCINRETTKKADELIDNWQKLMAKFQRPASSSIEAFMLDEDDPRVHRGRQEMARSANDEDRGPREVDWTKCQGRHQDYRADLFLGSKRPMTGWEDNGSCKMPDYAWADWGLKQVERIWDTLEISLLRNARRGFDSQYKTRVWELSQNIDRFTDTTPFGITGCVTPTGYPYVTNRGGPMIGLEGLSMQGLPIEKLLLTRESQKQLQDLAGNAMTSTVVGAAMIAALTVGYRCLERGDSDAMVVDSVPDVSHHICGDDALKQHELSLTKFDSTSVDSILADVRRSRRLCLCEGRHLLTSSSLQRCKLCGHATCVKCGGNPQHRYELLTKDETDQRMPPVIFEENLKRALPMRLTVAGLTPALFQDIKDEHHAKVSDKDWNLLLEAIKPAFGAELRFYSLKRAQIWTAFYESPHARLELVLNPVQAEWRLFAKPAHKEPGDSRTRELLQQPFARMRPTGKDLVSGQWQLCLPVTNTFKVKFEGGGDTSRSWESRLGLQEPRFVDKKLWSKLRVSVEEDALQYLEEDISGEYMYLPDCGTASGSLHKRLEDGALPLFLFLDPTRLGDPKNDYFVFSNDIRRLNYGETRPIRAAVDSSWRPSSKVKSQSVNCRMVGQWFDGHDVKLQPVQSDFSPSFAIPPIPLPNGFLSKSCAAANAILSCEVPLIDEEVVGWKKGPWVEVDSVHARTFFASFAWLTEKARVVKGLEIWREFDVTEDMKRCQQCAPDIPALRWKVEKQKMTPYEDPQQAGPYERALKDRPTPFVTQARIDDANIGHLRIGLNVASLIHRALATLRVETALRNQTDAAETTAAWRLITDYVAPSRLSLPKFKLQSNKNDPGGDQPPNIKMPLRVEQLRSLEWMRSQESDDAPSFVEEEVEEAWLPHLGWLAEARASKPITVRGGVLADQVGYGKTAITLGLIDAQAKSPARLNPPPVHGKISIKATLVVVPSSLIKQWDREIRKFLGTRYRVIAVSSDGDLKRLGIKDFMAADIIIVSWPLLTTEKYLSALATFAALPEMPDKTGGRAYDSWHERALDQVAEHVELLKSETPQLHAYLKKRLTDMENDESMKHHVPSKRLKGAAYREAQANGTGGPPKKKQKMTSAPSVSYNPFQLGSSGVQRDWTLMKYPLFEMFHFNRLVVDEYTYVKDGTHTSVTQLQAWSRWVLSGTPPMGDFADIKTIAVFLGINLGVNDDSSSALKERNVKDIRKYQTAVEKFRAFNQTRSAAWHERRNEVAQNFLDQFVRQNIAEIDEIPSKEHLEPVILPAAERAIYMELNQHLMAQDMRIRKGRTRVDNDRERRLNQMLGESKSPEEALLKRCSHFTLENLSKDRENAIQACEIVVKEREAQFADLLQDLEKSLREAVWLKKEGQLEGPHYERWILNVKNNAFGDLEATKILMEKIDTATAKYGPGGEKRSTSHKHKKGKDAAKSKAKPKPKPKAKKPARRKNRKVVSDDEDDEDEEEETAAETSEDEESDPDPGPRTNDQMERDLREQATHLRRLSVELVSRMRSLRFFNVVRQLQLARSGLSTSAEGRTCSKCGRDDILPDALSVLTLCGHTACGDCLKGASDRSNECVVIGCKAPAQAFNVTKAAELGEEDTQTRTGRHYGRKLETIIDLINKRIPKEDQIILFVQFDDLMRKISDAFDVNGISHFAMLSAVKGRGNQHSNMISEFQDDTSKNRKRVLMLNPSNEFASGA
ncbi:MAG: hypothetical protein M1823_004888 [Watsoniomyces obsoletus]|nr:MAG: hypothetical protein M1823_004888 [Watsoniomyces obsoletus]